MTFHDSPTDIPDPEVVPKAKRRKVGETYPRRTLGFYTAGIALQTLIAANATYSIA